MALDTYLMELDAKALIAIIENKEGETKDNRLGARDVLGDRKLSAEEIKALAVEVNTPIAYKMIMADGISKDKVSMHTSQFLNEEEMRAIYIDQLDRYIKEKDQFRFDVWSYAVGGVL